LRHNFLNEKLCLQRDKFQNEFNNASEIIKKQEESTAIQPKEMSSV